MVDEGLALAWRALLTSAFVMELSHVEIAHSATGSLLLDWQFFCNIVSRITSGMDLHRKPVRTNRRLTDGARVVSAKPAIYAHAVIDVHARHRLKAVAPDKFLKADCASRLVAHTALRHHLHRQCGDVHSLRRRSLSAGGPRSQGRRIP